MNEDDIRRMLASGEWEHFVSRPFSLFAVSLWNICYAKYIPLITDGKASINDGIFIQDKDGMVHSYRKTKEMNALKTVLADMMETDKSRIGALLDDAVNWNKVAEMACAEHDTNFEQAIELVCKVTVFCSVLPRFLAESMVEKGLIDDSILDQCIQLKKVSPYPKLIKEVLMPLARQQMEKLEDIRDVEFASVKELLGEEISHISGLEKKPGSGHGCFVYVSDDGKTDLFWTNDPDTFVRAIEGMTDPDNGLLKGDPVFPGTVRGRAYVHTSFDGADPKQFDHEYVLVTTDSNPNIRNLIEASQGMVVEEGKSNSSTSDDFSPGILEFKKRRNAASHGYVLSHEFGIPCIMGVRNATKLIKTGDLIEVDAFQGVVRIIK